ncbi:MAG TPA: hypothetical protein VH643_00895 [Gemmataceae bacterium]
MKTPMLTSSHRAVPSCRAAHRRHSNMVTLSEDGAPLAIDEKVFERNSTCPGSTGPAH